MLSDLLRVASTGPAFEPPLLVSDGPAAVPGPDETSCPACEKLRSAAEARRKRRRVNIYRDSQRSKLHSDIQIFLTELQRFMV